MNPKHSSTIDVTVERFISASSARLYRALTDANELEQWFFSDVQTDARQGGAYKIRWRSVTDESKTHDRFGRYLELEPDRKIMSEWKGDRTQKLGLDGINSTIVTITLTPERDGTRVKLVHSGWPTDENGRKWAPLHEGGWTFYLENLSNYVSSGPDLRERTHGQAVKSAATR
ncbi:MAG: SRPBCC family protein [Phycisphaerales bacterium]